MTFAEEIPAEWRIKCARCQEYFDYRDYKSDTCLTCEDEINYEKREKEGK